MFRQAEFEKKDFMANSILILGAICVFSMILSYGFILILLVSPLPQFFTDKPNPRKVHQNETPRLGGVGIITCFLMALLCWVNLQDLSIPMLDSKLLMSVVLFALGIFLVGFFDDTLFTEINNKYKFVYEIIITTAIVMFLGTPLETIYIFSNLSFNIGWLGIPLSIIWIVGISNAINIIDGIDGLAGTVSLIGFLSIGILAGIAGHTSIMILCALIIGLLIGFLFHNISPALVFLGDTGSLFIGIMLGYLTLYIITIPEMEYSILVAPMLIGFPILDVGTAMARRYLRACIVNKKGFNSFGSIFVADSEHIHHRIMYKGLNHTSTCIVLAVFSLILSISAIALSFISDTMKVVICVYLSLMILRFIIKLNFMDRIFAYFKKRFIEKDSKTENGIRITICVMNANEVLKHSLEECRPESLLFDFRNREDFSVRNNPYSVIIININNYDENQIKEEKKYIKSILRNRKDCHVILAVDKSRLYTFGSLCKNSRILFKSKPLDIPVLLNGIIPFAQRIYHTSAFGNMFVP